MGRDPNAPGPRTQHIPALDGVRGLAVLIVFVFHYGGGTHSSLLPMRIFGLLNKGGWSGVVLFFVLSGFLITGILWDGFDDRHWWRKFFARRSLRIFPLYFLALLLVVLGSIFFGDVKAVLRHIWIPALFLENFPHLGAISENLPSPFPTFHLWSIAVEEQFYLIWPFLLFAQRTRQHARTLSIVTFAASFVFRLLLWRVHPQPSLYDHFLLTQAGALAAGAWLALSFRGPEWPRLLRVAPYAACAGLVGFLLSGLASHTFEGGGSRMMTWGLPSVTVLFAAILALTLQPGWLADIFSMRWLRWLGGISYGVYVYHILLLGLITHVTDAITGGRSHTVHLAVQFVVAATLTLAAATLSYHFYEKQFLRLKRYFAARSGRQAEARG